LSRLQSPDILAVSRREDIVLRRTLIAVAILACVASRANAQEIRGTLTLGDSSTAAAGVIVEASNAIDGTIAGRTLTNQAGYFVLRVAGGQTVSVRALRIGNRPTALGTFTLAAGEVRTIRAALTGATVELDRVTVVGAQSCELGRGDAVEALTLYEEARKAITATQLTTTGGRMTAEWTLESQLVSLRGQPISDPTVRTLRAPTEQPFVSLPVDSLAKHGYLKMDGEDWVYQAPDANVLLSSRFVNTNCFRAVPWTRDSSDRVGLAFTPVRPLRDGIVEIEGTLWFDRTSAELRLLEYKYVGVPRDISGTNAGGEVHFLKLPTGQWLVHWWNIRMPRPTAYDDANFSAGGSYSPNRARTRTIRIRSMEVASGSVREILRGGTVLFRAPAPAADMRAAASGVADLCNEGDRRRSMIYGTLRDSLGQPVGNVDITATWTENHRYFTLTQRSHDARQMQTETSESGFWYLCGIPTGQRLDVRPDIRGVDAAPTLVIVQAESAPSEVKLVTAQTLQPSGSIVGVVVDSLRGGIRFAETEVRIVGSTLRQMTDRNGEFRFDGVPVGVHELVVSDPTLEFLGIPAPRVSVGVTAADGRVTIGIATMSAATYVRSVCGRDLPDGEGVLYGEIRDTRGIRQTGQIVKGTWSRMAFGRGFAQGSKFEISDTTDARGRYMLCGVPETSTLSGGNDAPGAILSGEVTLVSRGERLSTGDVIIGLGGLGFARRDLVVGDAERSTVLSGRVLDQSGQPIAGAFLVLQGTSLSAQSDAAGRWRLEGVPVASGQITVRAIRYLPRTVDLDPAAGRLTMPEIRLDRIPQQLDAVLINGGSVSGARAGFEERRTAGIGKFFDDEWIAGQPEVTVQAVVAQLPRGRLVRDTTAGLSASHYKLAFESEIAFSSGSDLAQEVGRTCFPTWYVDGVEYRSVSGMEEAALLRQAVRIEVYRGSQMPMRYVDFTGCGVILIWTYV
jgi:hypothetical protein